MRPEPKFIRITRASRRDLFARCERCGKLLQGRQEKWCGNACRQYGTRWKRAMLRHWEANAQAS